MNIKLVRLQDSAYEAMLELYRTALPRLHTLVEDPLTADMILFVGRWSIYGHGILDNPLVLQYPEKSFVYNDDDVIVPLLPGVYASATKPGLFSLHRLRSQKFIDWPNPHISPLTIQKQYLFSFAGRASAPVRARLFRLQFNRTDVFVSDTSHYDHWKHQPGREDNQRSYATVIAQSHFALCPRGNSAGSCRLFEVMKMGIAPVILSDAYLLPEGPDWTSFALVLPESRIADLPVLLEPHVARSAEMGRLARLAYEQWFDSPAVFNHIIHLCQEIRAQRRIPERWIQPLWRLMLWKKRCVLDARKFLRSLLTRIYRILGRRFVYEEPPAPQPMSNSPAPRL